ncbi:flagellar motor switch protein FliN [Alcaligenaceae bacterium]|nr:flagellar motor switch protein FliN [Alcaligenaceae bacterium]
MTDPKNDPAQENTSADDMDVDWAAAMAEQTSSSQAGLSNQADGLAQDVDDWASALAEQTAAEAQASSPAVASESSPTSTGTGQSAVPHVFPPLIDSDIAGNSDIDMIMDIPVQLTVELGRTRMTIKNILQLGQGSVVELDGLAGEPMDIFVNGYLIAQGEVVVVDDKYGIRVTDIITPSDRINRLNSRR